MNQEQQNKPVGQFVILHSVQTLVYVDKVKRQYVEESNHTKRTWAPH